MAVGHGGDILTSPDAITWTLLPDQTNDALVSVTYGNGVFVASSLNGTVLTSSNGTTWTEQDLAGGFKALYGVTWGNGFFVTSGDTEGFGGTNGAHLWSSPDGVTWTRQNSMVNQQFFGITFGGDRFVSVGVDGSIIRSNVVVSTAVESRYINLSNRALVGTGDDILIGSMIITGSPLRIYARVGGPSLPASITNPLLDPDLEVIQLLPSGNVQVGENFSWRTSQEALIQSTGIPPADDLEPAIVRTLQPGTYSIVVRGVGVSTGFANVEIYEFRDPAETEHGSIINLSNRAFVGTGDNILIGSLIVQGDTARRVYARVGGPSLPASITNPLQDPELELVQVLGSGNVSIDTNDNWKDSQQVLIESTGIPPASDNEPAMVATLQPGTYSIIVRGVGATTGFANVEIYDFP